MRCPDQMTIRQAIMSPPPLPIVFVAFSRSGISELVSVLHERGVVVYLVSGGFRQVRYGVYQEGKTWFGEIKDGRGEYIYYNF